MALPGHHTPFAPGTMFLSVRIGADRCVSAPAPEPVGRVNSPTVREDGRKVHVFKTIQQLGELTRRGETILDSWRKSRARGGWRSTPVEATGSPTHRPQ